MTCKFVLEFKDDVWSKKTEYLQDEINDFFNEYFEEIYQHVHKHYSYREIMENHYDHLVEMHQYAKDQALDLDTRLSEFLTEYNEISNTKLKVVKIKEFY
ncbi:hypothetical protein [Staphylococcus hyicus]|uniref:hypothetical protein n=1 Tax=Staphylococcus hyicus TaxID=1284 RepID=UPI0031334259